MFHRFVDSVGDGSGTKNMGTTADIYYLTAPAGREMDVHRSIWHIVDTGTFAVATIGAATAFATGVKVSVEDADGNEIVDLTDGVPITNNGDFARFSYDVRYDSFGAGDNALVCRWSFDKAGAPLHLDPGWSLVVNVQDSAAALVEFYCGVQGVYT